MQAPQNVQMFALLFMVITPQVALLFDKCESSTYLYVQMNADDYSSYELSDNLPPLLEAPVLKREPTMRGIALESSHLRVPTIGLKAKKCMSKRNVGRKAERRHNPRLYVHQACSRVPDQEAGVQGCWQVVFYVCQKEKRSNQLSVLAAARWCAVQARDSGTNGRDM